MNEWAQKVFWKGAAAVPVGGGFAVQLDGRGIKTPAKAPLVVPTMALAEGMAAEWGAQQDTIKPLSMPLTRAANAAIDKVAVQKAEVVEMLTAYGGTDLVCYRAESPEELIARQAAAWDPALDWAEIALGARLKPVTGVMFAPQDPEALAKLHDLTSAFDVFELAAFHDLVSLSGSLVLGFAAAAGWKSPEALWEISRIDEVWQAEFWGRDDEAEAAAAVKREAFLQAKRFLDLCRCVS